MFSSTCGERIMDKDGFLRQVPLFQSLRPEDIQNLCDSTRTHSCKKGDVLFRKGSEGTTLYIIKKGRIKIVLPSKDGDEVILAIFSEKYFFGENRLPAWSGLPEKASTRN